MYRRSSKRELCRLHEKNLLKMFLKFHGKKSIELIKVSTDSFMRNSNSINKMNVIHELLENRSDIPKKKIHNSRTT